MEQGKTLDKSSNQPETTDAALMEAVAGLWDSIRAVADELKALRNENFSLKEVTEKLRNLGEEIASLRQTNEELAREKEDILLSSTTVEELTKELDGEWERAEKHERENKELLLKIKELEENEKNFSFARQEIVRKNHELNDRAEEIIKLKDKVSELDSKLYEYENLHWQIDEILEKNKALEFKISELEDSREKTETEGEYVESDEKTKFEEEIRKYRHAWEAQEQALRKYSLQMQQLQTQKTDTDRKHEEALAKNLHLAEELKELHSQNQKLIEQIGELQKLRDQVSSKSNLIDDLTVKLKILDEEKIAAEADITDYKVQINTLADSVSEIRQEKEELEKALGEKESIVKGSEQQKEQTSRLELELKQLNDDLLIKNRQIQDLNITVDNLKREIESLKSLQDDSESGKLINIELENRLLSAIEARNLLTIQADELNKTINDNKIKINELETKIQSLDEENKNTESIAVENLRKIDILEQELKTKNSTISSLTEQISKIEIEKEDYYLRKEDLLKRVEKYLSKLDHIMQQSK